ncbi:Hypothetical predicted protein [Mytilus galloprovincialis]|uniref:NTR domain-containing protein n=1 Tax=Mytilus galloprovincialis TaxID=29158 RepID=A0A8B6BRV4_MYTGA|nr:Hypothetical predicted protein [Mytilus galloprovincialis]
MSEQCECPAVYTQQLVCDDPLVVEAKIESFSESDYNKNYQISVTKFFKGKEAYDKLSDKTTLKTPKESAACGPVVFKVGSSYILSVSVSDGNMHHNLCGLQVDASSAKNILLEGLAGKYQENCDCEIPYMYDPPPFGPRSNNQCGLPPDSHDTVCARHSGGQCYWENCAVYNHNINDVYNPYPNADYNPNPNAVYNLNPNDVCNASPNSVYNPYPNAVYNPNRNAVYNINPNAVYNPNPNAVFNPNPNYVYNPNPNDVYNPNSNDVYNPSRNAVYNPNPNDVYNPNPNAVCNVNLNADYNRKP